MISQTSEATGILLEEPPIKENPRTCVTCKHLLGKRERKDLIDDWRCHHPNNIKQEGIDPVTGDNYTKYKVDSIRAVRQFHIYFPKPDHPGIPTCDSKWWEEYVYVPYVPPTIGGNEATDITFDPEALAKGREAAKARMEAIKNKRKLSSSDLTNL